MECWESPSNIFLNFFYYHIVQKEGVPDTVVFHAQWLKLNKYSVFMFCDVAHDRLVLVSWQCEDQALNPDSNLNKFSYLQPMKFPTSWYPVEGSSAVSYGCE